MRALVPQARVDPLDHAVERPRSEVEAPIIIVDLGVARLVGHLVEAGAEALVQAGAIETRNVLRVGARPNLDAARVGREHRTHGLLDLLGEAVG